MLVTAEIIALQSGAGQSLCTPQANTMTKRLTAESIRRGLHTGFVGQQVVCLDSVTSTNDAAKRLAQEGAPEGTLVVAEEQTAGRGRQGRRWIAPAGSSLLLSLVFRPSLTPAGLPQLLMASSLAVAEAIEDSTGLSVRLKWPNDILLGSKKVGGILIEAGLSGERTDYAVVGIGLNVNLDTTQIPEIAASAASLSAELGRRVPRLRVLHSLLRAMEREYLLLQGGESPHGRWVARLDQLGHEVEISTPWRTERGRLDRVSEDGTLILRRLDGTEVPITVGDVT
jgi:BirA family biotin operon repressor/biotin-[acetyl-CoA-carboxylase] ligase